MEHSMSELFSLSSTTKKLREKIEFLNIISSNIKIEYCVRISTLEYLRGN
jgi:hypothetical protein